MENLEGKHILDLLCVFFYFWIDYDDSACGMPPFGFHIFIAFPSLDDGHRRSVADKEMKDLNRG